MIMAFVVFFNLYKYKLHGEGKREEKKHHHPTGEREKAAPPAKKRRNIAPPKRTMSGISTTHSR